VKKLVSDTNFQVADTNILLYSVKIGV